MFSRYCIIALICCSFLLLACAGKETSIYTASAIPKKVGNEVEKKKLEQALYEPYKKLNTIEGYMEFVKKYPYNHNVALAQRKIEKLELIDCEIKNTVICFREYLEKYPKSAFIGEARMHLEELECRQFDHELRKNYGFDLLLYRLNLKRLKSKLYAEGKEDLGDFEYTASFAIVNGKKYFRTHLIFNNTRVISKYFSGKIHEEIFNHIISKQFAYLNSKFKKKKKIYGYGFAIAVLPLDTNENRESVLEYYFPLNQAELFAGGKIDKDVLFDKSVIISH